MKHWIARDKQVEYNCFSNTTNLNNYGNKGWELIEQYKGCFMLKNLINWLPYFGMCGIIITNIKGIKKLNL